MKKLTKRIMSLTVTAAMLLPLSACGGSSSQAADTKAAAGTPATTAAAAATTAAAAAGDEGKTLNIECWNEEFKSRVTDHYPGYEKVDDTTGKIGDVTVHWIITPNDDNAYQNNLDSILPDNENASTDDKVDIFLMEADYALKYVNSDVTMKLSDLGITDSDLADQFDYTKDIVKDSDGNLKGASWQACSAGLIYNRAAAKEILGTDEPEKVQEAVADWDKFNDLAAKAKDKGYKITSTVNDTYRVYSNNVSAPWVVDDKVKVDDNIKKWVDSSKKLVDAGETSTADLWSDDWSKGFFPDGKVFCYFGPAWLINFSMHADEAGSIANEGGWGLCEGPQSFYWGGTWIAAAAGTDNPTLVKDIILTMTTNKDVLKEIVVKDSDCVNSKSLLKELADDETFQNKVLGGQNPYKMLEAGAEKVDMSNISDYDQGCNEEFQSAMKNYFDGNTDYDGALAQFNKAIVEKYPALTTD